MYLGGVIFLGGLSITVGNILSLIIPLIFFVIMDWMFISYEEEKMEVEIGKDYLDYMKKVRRWI